jgi:uncharacterized protein YqeY
MSLESIIQDALKIAMLEKNQAALRTLRAVKSAIVLIKTDKGFEGEVTNAQEVLLLQKLVKQRKESGAIFSEQNRDDLASKEFEEVEIIQTFLPKQLSEEELTSLLKDVIAETGASSMKDMGRVIGLANQRLAGQAEGQVIAKIVKNSLQ